MYGVNDIAHRSPLDIHAGEVMAGSTRNVLCKLNHSPGKTRANIKGS